MPINARTWTEIDKKAVDVFIKYREENGSAPIRNIAKRLGFTYSRFRDILNKQNGVLTLDEFCILCDYFDLRPSSVLQEIESTLDKNSHAAERLEDEQRSQSPTISPAVDDDVPLAADGEVDYTELTRRFNPEELGMAAYRDPNKYIESQTPTE